MVHEQKFKDLLSSTCQVSIERIVLDLESEVIRDPGSISTGGNMLSLEFFYQFCQFANNSTEELQTGSQKGVSGKKFY